MKQELLKVVIVDDEPWIRSLIRGLVPWKQLNLEVVGEASDGEDGLELCQEVRPHIVLTDIRMPGLTGLELVQKLLLFCPEAMVIIISGHDDFGYAQEAIKHGVFGYVLKPVDEKELTEILNRAKAKIGENAEQGQSQKKLETELKKLQDSVTASEGIEEVDSNLDPRIQKALHYVHEHYHEDVTLEEVAEEVFMGASYLSETFKQEMGKGFSEYLTHYRLEKAKRLLEHSQSLKVNEVASMVGYRDSNYFTKVFKKKIGMKPSDYQTSIQEK